MKRNLLWMLAVMLVVVSVQAQRRGCVHRSSTTRADDSNALPVPYDFDPQKTYRVPVILISFSDMDFSMDNPVAYYNSFFNEPGFNEGAGPGCVADYFRDQSSGRLNLQFDIYGPVKVDNSVSSHYDLSASRKDVRQALDIMCKTVEADFTVYDWDGVGRANMVVFMAAGMTGSKANGYEYLTPYSESQLMDTKLPGNVDYFFYSLACERWETDNHSGFGPIVHEFFHGLGLPDLYPAPSASNFSTVDEWDLMDGGYLTNYGWCPPSLSAMELMYLGWATPEELTEPSTIKGMKPLSEGGKTYLVRSTSNSDEYYLLENRRQEGWDFGCPGNGLLIFHVDFDMDAWRDNLVNTSDQHYRYDLFHASGIDFRAWCPQNNGFDYTRWTWPDWLRSSYLSTSAYPYTDATTLAVNNCLTDESSPAATLFTPAADGRNFMGKSITNIQLAADGTISFDFMKNKDTGIVTAVSTDVSDVWHTIDGRRLNGPQKGLNIIKTRNDQTRKILVK